MNLKINRALREEVIKIVDERIRKAHVTKEDFTELKNIVKELGTKVSELAEAQKRTEQKVSELAEAQKRTEQKVTELAEAQKRTEQKVTELAEAQRRAEIEIRELAKGLKDARRDLGGLSRTISYAFENEAFRNLPKVLQKYGIKVKEKFARLEIEGKEINFFAEAEKENKEVIVVGEAKLRLDLKREEEKKLSEERDVFEELEEKALVVWRRFNKDTVKILITHFATESFLDLAKGRDIIVIQSFEW